MAAPTATNAQGEVFEFVGGQWRPQRAQPSTAESIAIGAGATFANVGRGAADLVAAGVEQLPFAPDVSGFRQGLAQDVQVEQPMFNELQQQQPIATGVGQALPFLATAPIAGASIPAQATLGAIEGGIQFGTPEERLQRALIGGGLGAGGGAVLTSIQRVSKAISNSAANIAARRGGGLIDDSAGAARVTDSVVGTGSQSKPRQILQNAGTDQPGTGAQTAQGLENLKRGRELGLIFEPGDASGNIAAKQLFAAAKRNPLVSDIVQSEVSNANRDTFTKLTLRALGDNGDEITNATLVNAKNRLGKTRDRIFEATPKVKVDAQAVGEFKTVIDDFVNLPSVLSKEAPTVRRIQKLVDEIGDSGNKITSKRYQVLRSDMRGLQRSAKTSSEINSIGDAIEVLDNMFGRSVGKANKKAFDKSTQQFRLIEALEKPGVISGELVLRPGALGRNLKKIFKSEFGGVDEFGGLDRLPEFRNLFDATKVANFFPNVVNDSGTATNLSLQGIFSNPVGTAAQLSTRPLLRQVIKSAQPQF